MRRRIPNIFHLVYGLAKQTEPFHLLHYLCIESLRRVNQPQAIYFHCHHLPFGPYWELSREQVRLRRVEPAPLVRRRRYGCRHRACWPYAYAHHADFIRLAVLLSEGGVYADLDTIFVRPLPARLFEQSFVLGREDDLRQEAGREVLPSLCNAFIMAEPGAPFLRLWSEAMAGSFDGSWSEHSTLLPQRLASLHPELIHIEPSRSFYPFMWSRDGLRRLLVEREADLSGVLSVHLWAHLWWEERRKDFSEVHAGMVSEQWIRTVDTTYGLLARPFLPPGRA
jgi:hypothetical protein